MEHEPDQWRGEYDGQHTVHGDPIPCRVTLEWTDGATSEHNAVTKQWTRSHVRVLFRQTAERLGIRCLDLGS